MWADNHRTLELVTTVAERPQTRTKDARVDLRMSSENRETIARAAEINGLGLTDYMLSVTLPAARADIDAARTISLSSHAFNAFLDLLDAPDTPQAAALRSATTMWDAQ